jgi:hypothetical protein
LHLPPFIIHLFFLLFPLHILLLFPHPLIPFVVNPSLRNCCRTQTEIRRLGVMRHVAVFRHNSYVWCGSETELPCSQKTAIGQHFESLQYRLSL